MKKLDDVQILNAKPTRQYEWREYRKGSLLENGLALNEIATFIWKLCDSKRAVKEIIKSICDQYEVDKQTAETEAIECIKELLDEDALKLQ